MKILGIVLVLGILGPAPARAGEILISNTDLFMFNVFLRFSATQWLTASFTTDDNTYELESVDPTARATQLTAGVVAELRSGSTPGALISSLTRDPGVPVIFRPDTPVTLLANTTYHFSLGYPLGNPTITDWYGTESFDSVGPATMEQGWVSSDQGATWQTGGGLEDQRFYFDVIVAPESSAALSAGAGLAALAALCQRGRARPSLAPTRRA